MTSKPDSKVVVVTGASSGIGSSVARLFAQQGARVVLAARREDRLRELADELVKAGHEALVVPVDLVEAEQVVGLVAQTVDAYGRIDVLVNNAGYGMQCEFADMEPDGIARMFSVNVLASMGLARAATRVMLRQGTGSIINVASVGGVVAHPLNVVYCASKHAVVGFSKSLRLELKGTGVRVTVVCPGATRTEFFDVAHDRIPFGKMIETFAVPPETVARCIVKASRKNRALVFPTVTARFLYLLDRWLPWFSELGNLRYRDRARQSALRADEP